MTRLKDIFRKPLPEMNFIPECTLSMTTNHADSVLTHPSRRNYTLNVQVHLFPSFVRGYPLTNLPLYAIEGKHLISSSEITNEEPQKDIRHIHWVLLLVCETLGRASVVQGVQKVLSSTGASEWPGKQYIEYTS
jgi:hypothetical protein